MRLNDLPEGRYFDGTYEWDWDGEEWYPLRAPSGMPPTPRLEDLSRVISHREPLNPPTAAVGVYHADDYLLGFDEQSTIEAWWIELELGHLDLSGETDDFITEQVLSLSDVEAMNLAAHLVELVGIGRARTSDDWQPVPLPEKDRDLLRKLLKGIAGTWGTDDEFPDWRENEYARGQLELVIEICRVVTDEEYERGDGDTDLQRDRITNWIRKGAWR